MPSARYVTKKRIDEVTKSRVLNDASLEPHVIKCPRKNVNYNTSNISGKVMGFSTQSRSDYK